MKWILEIKNKRARSTFRKFPEWGAVFESQGFRVSFLNLEWIIVEQFLEFKSGLDEALF